MIKSLLTKKFLKGSFERNQELHKALRTWIRKLALPTTASFKKRKGFGKVDVLILL